MKACFIGLGYIGLPTAIVAADNGVEVVGVDVNPHVVETINFSGWYNWANGLYNLNVTKGGVLLPNDSNSMVASEVNLSAPIF